ncbi:hypothetical protein FD755_006374 [Muntiacus reevesi]|uniref:RUN domain-containing protein n=1 Tax=Muntiacus reevesi TaxID=9886 RepID=A0A5J5MX32_MUNRE|nr:hypothetical protein FD755_006374 [Muntiacus reevesi]
MTLRQTLCNKLIIGLTPTLGKRETSSPVFWFYVKEVLSKHELQRFYALRHIASDVGRGRAWLRCALNENSLERYLHMLLADRGRLSTFYEDWAFVMDEERSSMLPTMAAGLNSILFAINIDNKDLNGQSKFAPTVSDLLKESTQNVTSLLKESTQGVSSLFREITASSAVSILSRAEQETDPLPVVSKHVSADAKCKRERKKKKKVTNIISFDDEEDEQSPGDVFKKIPGAGESSEENSDRSSINIMSAFESPFGPNSNGSQGSNSWKIDSLSLNGEFGYQKLDVKSIDDEDVDENEDDVYGSTPGRKRPGHSESPEKPRDGGACLSQMHGWAPLQVLHGHAEVLFPVSGVGSYGPADAPLGSLENGTGPEDHVLPEPGPRYSVEASPPGQESPLSSLLPSASVPESMTVRLRKLDSGSITIPALSAVVIFLPGKSHGQRSLAGYSPRDHRRTDFCQLSEPHTAAPGQPSSWSPSVRVAGFIMQRTLPHRVQMKRLITRSFCSKLMAFLSRHHGSTKSKVV